MSNRAVLSLTVAVAVVGAVDAAVSVDWDLFVVFVLVGVLQLVLLLRLSGRRPSLPVRADLVRWLRDRAASEGESTERIVDRAVSAYRDGMVVDTGEQPPVGPSPR